jgi:hypothetical protein
MINDDTYCAKSNNCKNTNCPKHLNGFNGLYVSLAEFDCESILITSEWDNLLGENE